MKASKYFRSALLILVLSSCTRDLVTGRNDTVTVEFNPDMKSLVRNPLSGWVLYDDANDYVAKADEYWQSQDMVSRKFASIFYWRSRWSELEPREGEYAWEHDENFKALIQGALDRGLKLAFCIYVDGQDNIFNGTPDFVREAGAEGYAVHRLWDPEGVDNNWTPYSDDPVFQDKFSNFIKAFAREFDNPAKVDFVDGFNLGWWGEGHHIRYKNNANKAATYRWITDLYGNSFKNVILVTNFGTEMGWEAEKQYAVAKHGYIIRRNSLGSTWFRESEKQTVLSVFPETAFIAECCYWGGFSDSYQPWSSDPLYGNVFKSWPDFYNQAYIDAIQSRANTLDLREVTESRGWTKRALELVEQFKINGGYRLTPTRLSFPAQAQSGTSITISHSWRNSGVGVCPNNNVRWNRKYQVAFALLDRESAAVSNITIVPEAEPSAWLKGKDACYESEIRLEVPAGKYTLLTAIVDTSIENTPPGLNLAVEKGEYHEGWLQVSEIDIK